ncbi:peptidylprolyl isomerase [Roseateles koreensis]|uniref:Peptidylprolyl isomerase n=1 Tax=Roseateles koreensis TaxID=2987526 RepID=A0ABT5KTJ0_9BURK|nr:peptidylprolyl isomerase [Roseateles koreensis]MDC8786258.1 peptidylprolyl isomerase [Roseateles koreensis]
MSASLSTSATPATASKPPATPRSQGHSRLQAALREPLLHFVLLGGMLFLADHWLMTRADDPRTIVMGPEVDAEATQIFSATRGHAPNAEELAALRQVWLDNEVLYREGLALQVDKGDASIRERVIFKALSVVDANVKLPKYDDKTLRSWFESHRVKYDEPPRYDFQEAVLDGTPTEAAVRAFVDALNAGTPGDAKAGLRVFKGRPQANLLQSYGAEFAKSLAAAPVGEWRAQPTQDGWRAIRLDALTSGKPGDFESLRGVVLQDWTDTVMAEQRSAAVHTLAQKYKIKAPSPSVDAKSGTSSTSSTSSKPTNKAEDQ